MPTRPPIYTNGHRPGENGRPTLEKLAIASQSARFSSLARRRVTRSLLYLLMPTNSAKTIALEQRNFALEKLTYQRLHSFARLPPQIRPAWVISASRVRWRAGVGNGSAIVAIPI
jgi:hypothetical protein